MANHNIIILTTALSLSSCGGSLPPDRVYSLPLADAEKFLPGPVWEGILMVRRPLADSVLNSRNVVWRSSPAALTVGYYTNQSWNLAPPEQLQVQLEHCLGQSHIAGQVAAADAPVVADWLLSGRLLHFEQQLTGPADSVDNARVYIAADLSLSTRGERRQVWQEHIAASVALGSADPELIAAGMQQALTQFCRDLSQSLAAAGSGVKRTRED
jgi:ABC-type uncharacterized transport system auxiliary subunit